MSSTEPGRDQVQLATLQDEQKMLRAELNQLKGCQLQYFTLSVTGTAALFGFAATRATGELLGIAFLAPLAIVLPCWWIFFDKATTITRVVGYYRVIERMIAEYPTSDARYIGYERALALYRKEEDGTGRQEMKECAKVEELRRSHRPQEGDGKTKVRPSEARHRYWEINWWTYASLSTMCCALSLVYLVSAGAQWPRLMPPILSFLLVLCFGYLTWQLKSSAIRGPYSYNENHYFWEYIHSPACMARNGVAQPAD